MSLLEVVEMDAAAAADADVGVGVADVVEDGDAVSVAVTAAVVWAGLRALAVKR